MAVRLRILATIFLFWVGFFVAARVGYLVYHHLGPALGIGGVQARTFHAAALRQLRYFWPQVVGDTPWELLDRKLGLVGQSASRAGVSTSADSLRDQAGEIEWSKATLVAPEDYPAAAAA